MLPNFVIIGAEKCGTTSLYHYLRQHPSVFMCTPKEPEFFVGRGSIDTMVKYEMLFDEVEGEKAVGEASVRYFRSAQACTRLRETIPDARLIAVLRDPADRAYSHYNMMLANGAVPHRPYLDVLREARHKGDYRNTGLPTSRYAAPLRRYLEAFGRENLRIYLFRDYKQDSAATVRSIFEHIGVDPTFEPDTERHYNQGHRPQNNRMHRFIWGTSAIKDAAKAVLPEALRRRVSRAARRFNRSSVPPLSEEARSIIIEALREDIDRTEELLGRDLSAWKSSSAKGSSATATQT